MTQDFENMLYLFGANARGKETEPMGKLNIEAIKNYAVQQGIWTMVYPEICKICDAGGYYDEFWLAVSNGIARKEFSLSIIKKIEANGIKCCLLKGAALSELYADPECRISGDTDILIEPENEKRLTQILREYGYDISPRDKNDHHLKAYHKIGGLLEAHISLYSYMTEKIVFNDISMYNESWTTIDIGGYDYSVLGINDGVMYLTAHYIKHLVNSGGGVRQMMDLLLYIEKYKEQIDFERYERILCELKYDKLIEVVKSIGGKYFGFAYEVSNTELMNRILTDTQDGGIFGFSAEDRKNFYDRYCVKRKAVSRIKYYIMNITRAESSILFKLFPDKKTLMNCGYKYANTSVLIPIAWLHRLFNLIIKRVGSEKEIGEKNDRMKLMKDLGMID